MYSPISYSNAEASPGIATPDIKEIPVHCNAQYLLLMTDGVYKSVESMYENPPSSEAVMEDIAERVKNVHNCNPNKLHYLSREVLETIASEHRNVYQKHASVDKRSPLAVQCRKRDDMTLIVYKFP